MPPRETSARFGFGADRRLTGRVGFEHLLRSGRRRSVGGFTLYLAARASGPARLGILVTRRHSRLAHVRNSLKRCIREAFRLSQHDLGPVDVLVRPPLDAQPSPQMIRRLRRAFSSLRK